MAQFPAKRIQLDERAARQYGALVRLTTALELEERLRLLIDVRASQLNGCAFCIDMHWLDARAAGESEERLYSLSAWRESPLYSERERAALSLCEALTLVADSHVPDDVWDAAGAVLSPDELGQVVFATVVINAWNRVVLAARTEPGHYAPAPRRAA